MQRSDAWVATVTVERYLERCRLKTAVLFRAACQLGALEGGASLTTGLGSAIDHRFPYFRALRVHAAAL